MTFDLRRQLVLSMLALALSSTAIDIRNAFCAETKCTASLTQALEAAASGDRFTVWVFFTDKGRHESMKQSIPTDVVTRRALNRRARSLPADRLVDYTDLPVEPSYLNAVASVGCEVRQYSKWFNAVSVAVTASGIQKIESLPFVSTLDLVIVFKRPRSGDSVTTSTLAEALKKGGGTQDLDYGPSLPQVSLENIPAVHATGNSAQGIIIGMFDNGFRLLEHEAFDSLRSRIIAQYDFVDHKESVAPNNPKSTFGGHGINTLSTIAGFKPGRIIGPAYGASFILARTENDSSETPVEEDNWARAIEWAESLGVDITSTSLGYDKYDKPYTSWTWEDMDGETTLITRAAVMAARKGVIVVNSAGNEGVTRRLQPNSLVAPGDADSILTAGAVSPGGIRASFSSFGPTADRRIKPDVMAVGTSVYVADATKTTGYQYVQGTSFSCPLTAGVAALVLKAHPNASAMDVINAMKAAASRASNPDPFYGWGIVNAAATIAEFDTTGPKPPPPVPQTFSLSQNYPNPFNGGTEIVFTLPEVSDVSIRVFDILGREVATLISSRLPASWSVPFYIEWDGLKSSGGRAASGTYFYRLEAKGVSGSHVVQVKKMLLIK